MINEIKVLTTMNILLKNDIYNIHKDHVLVDRVAAAALWLQNITSHIKNSDAKINILKFIYDIVEKRLPELMITGIYLSGLFKEQSIYINKGLSGAIVFC